MPYHATQKTEDSLVYDLYSAIDKNIYSCDKKFIPVESDGETWSQLISALSNQAPNLTPIRSNWSRRSLFFAVIGLLVQVTVVILSAVITFRLGWFRIAKPFSSAIGFAIFVTGILGYTYSFQVAELSVQVPLLSA